MVQKVIQVLICLNCKTMTWDTIQVVYLSMKLPTWIASREEHQFPMALCDFGVQYFSSFLIGYG